MTQDAPGEAGDDLVFDVDLDAPPDKVWRALRLREFRESWLPAADLADGEPVAERPGLELRLRMREALPPQGESEVTFRLSPLHGGRTRLRIIHEPMRPLRARPAANDRTGPLMLAA